MDEDITDTDLWAAIQEAKDDEFVRPDYLFELDKAPSDALETATADREEWRDSTPTDAGESLFGDDE